MPGIGGRGIIAKPAVSTAKTITYLQHSSDATDLTTYTLSAVNLGTADAGRWIVVGIEARASGTTVLTVSSVTIGGVTATVVVQAENSPTNASCVAIAVANVPTGTTGDIVVTFSRGVLRCGVDTWSATGIGTTPNDTDSSSADPGTATLDTTASGVLVAVTATGTTATFTWTNATERYDGVLATAETGRCSVADATTSAGTLAVTAQGSTGLTEPITVFASW